MCIGYVRLAFMMIDRNIAYLSPSSVYRILVNAALNKRFHGTIKSEAIRDMPKFTLEQMKKEVEEWIRFYNYERLHSSLDYVSPMDVMEGRRDSILSERKRKILEGKQKRKEYSIKAKTIFEVNSPVAA